MNIPRYYQSEAEALILGELMSVRSTLLVMATGLGKTVVIGQIAKNWPGNVLVLAHRDELINQAWKRIEADTGEWVEIEKAESHSYVARIVVGSVQTMCSAKRLKGFKRDHFSLIITDEAHHSCAKSYTTIFDYFEKANLLGVTATPDRGDGVALGKVYESVAYQLDLIDGIEDGWLVPIRGHREHLDELDLSKVSKNAGELAPGELDEAIVLAVDAMVGKTVELYPGRRGLLFFPGVRSAELACEKFNLDRPGSAIVISGKTPTEERQKLVADFRKGRYTYLCNCMVATEGFDVPDIDLVVLCRPTLSRALVVQMVGRGTRTLAGLVDKLDGPERAEERRAAIASSAKPHMTVLDFVGNSGRHSLMGVEDVLGGKYTEAELKEAKKAAEAAADIGDGTYDPTAALEAARAVLKAMAQVAMPLVRSVTELFDPFADARREAQGLMRRGRDGRSASEGQLRYLDRLGVDAAQRERMSFAQASRFINACNSRKAKGLASYKQLKILRDWGVQNKELPALVASAAIDAIVAARWSKAPAVRDDVARIVGPLGVTLEAAQ